MDRVPDWAREARARWRFNGRTRPEFARAPREGERSVWDFPRPPAIEPVAVEISARVDGRDVARTRSGLCVLETASPPTYYFPPEDVDRALLAPSVQRSMCEWKGEAHYWDVVVDGRADPAVGWSYPSPYPDFAVLREYVSFYPARLECFVGDLRATPQPGGFYGGWVTPDLVGPFKGEPGVPPL